MKFFEYIFLFTLGAIGYGAIETSWRGYTHWTMLLTGGVCFLLVYIIANHSAFPFWQMCIASMAVITAIEFVVGLIVNVTLGWNVWDYSDMRYHLMGQICPMFSFFWLLLSVPGIAFSRLLRKFIFLPSYKKAQ